MCFLDALKKPRRFKRFRNKIATSTSIVFIALVQRKIVQLLPWDESDRVYPDTRGPTAVPSGGLRVKLRVRMCILEVASRIAVHTHSQMAGRWMAY